ncbi:type II toxin-antitoxin system VapC family toxin [bacterium]|nr:type II toxin-antitoxin system VapC family toxin [bacterium]
MKRYVLDSYAVLAYFDGEAPAQSVAQLFEKAMENHAQLFMCVVNWGEVYYTALRDGGKDKAELFRLTFLQYPVVIFNVDQDLTLQAAVFKAHNKISYADAFAAALTKLKKAELVTGDKEFKSLEKDIKIQWI